MQIKRRNVIWLSMLSVLSALAIISGLDAGSTWLLLGALGIAGAISLFDLQPGAIIKTVQDKTARGGKVSADAREATERARARGSYSSSQIHLIDVGLIALQDSMDGLVMQRTRNVSLDDNGVRPYISLQVPATEADRHANIRFEIDDARGKKIYIHNQQMYLRDGKMDILADMQMPLSDNELNVIHGDSDLRVYIDGDLIGVLGFNLMPSTANRWSGSRRQEANKRLVDEPREKEDDMPVSLEDLLRQQNNRNKQ